MQHRVPPGSRRRATFVELYILDSNGTFGVVVPNIRTKSEVESLNVLVTNGSIVVTVLWSAVDSIHVNETCCA